MKKWEQILIKDRQKYAKEQSSYEINEGNDRSQSEDAYNSMMKVFSTNLKELKNGSLGNSTTLGKNNSQIQK